MRMTLVQDEREESAKCHDLLNLCATPFDIKGIQKI
jgi:hypothetical protein